MAVPYVNPLIESLFEAFREVFGKDFLKYRNHVYRVYLNCLLMDGNKDHEEKYVYAAFFHDIGIWTAGTFDYLQPSVAAACKYLGENGKGDMVADITLMIYWHHKIKRYKGYRYQLVDIFRRADWIDVSCGIINFGCNRKLLSANKQKFPGMGFHHFLVWQAIKYFSRHPFNPLPMFKR